jgi:hypothetical protein
MFLLNRIQNVVVPLRQSRYDTSRLPWYRRIFPLDMSSTKTRTILRLPTMVLCLRALLLWTVVTSQVAGFFPGWKILEPLGDWAARMPMEDVSWTVFISVVAAIAVASFARGLEGHTHLGNSQPFNVVSGLASRWGLSTHEVPGWICFHAPVILPNRKPRQPVRRLAVSSEQACTHYDAHPAHPGSHFLQCLHTLRAHRHCS